MKYIVALSGVENQNLLKEEIRHFYPDLNLSFSHKNFLTFKLENERLLSRILNSRPAFARLWKEGGKIEKEEIKAKYIFDRKEDTLFVTEAPSENLLIKINEKSFMEVKDFRPHEALILSPKVEEEPNAPSRAYYKLAEAFKLTGNSLTEKDILLELGSSPGGATYFALKNKAKVIGVDPGEMDKFLFDKYPETFKHLKLPVQTLDPLDLPIKTNFVACDMNLNPHQSLRETMRVMEPLINVKCLFFTLKIVKTEHISLLDDFKRKVEKKGYKVEFYQLPTHRKECLLYARRL